jgi:hypothetical protein
MLAPRPLRLPSLSPGAAERLRMLYKAHGAEKNLNAQPAPAPPPAHRAEAVTPRSEKIKLFNGKDLSGLYTYLEDTKDEDPKGVFRVENGMLRIAGKPYGYIATKQEYKDYHLVLEYKWGKKTYGSKTVRNNGILLHATGPDGNRSPWMASIECQLAQGCAGDLIVIRGKDAGGNVIPVNLTTLTMTESDGRTRWNPEGTPTPYAGRQFWWSRHDPAFEEKIDTRGRWDVESRPGGWTRVECTARGDRITVMVNGYVVNECYNAYPSSGKILLQSEGFEMWVRRFELCPLPENRP